MASWRLAKSLVKLRDQINAAAPKRSKASDGSIGDAAHSARSSDHNPRSGVVHAIDVTNDPYNGMSAQALADSLVASKDKRIKYLIWNKRIWNPSVSPLWRAYTGTNPHTKHIHISVNLAPHADNEAPWEIGVTPYPTEKNTPPKPDMGTLKKGDKGENVRKLQGFLGITTDGDFGPQTHAAVVAFQKAQKPPLVADGVVGAYTWEMLLKPPTASLVAQNKPRTPPGKLRTSEKGRKHIQGFESLELHAHKVGEVWHIGWGHSATSGKPPIPKEGMTITADEADRILERDLLEYEFLIGDEVKVDLTQGQFDALISISFNKGPTWFRKSALLKFVNAEDWDRAALAIMSEHPPIGDKFYNGLFRRRKAEADLFRS